MKPGKVVARELNGRTHRLDPWDYYDRFLETNG